MVANARMALSSPFSFNEASAHPVKMFKSFHVDSPCRTSTSLCEYSCVLLLMDEATSDDDVMKVGVMCRRFVAEWGATNADVAEMVARMRRSDDFMIVGIMIFDIDVFDKKCIQVYTISYTSESGKIESSCNTLSNVHQLCSIGVGSSSMGGVFLFRSVCNVKL